MPEPWSIRTLFCAPEADVANSTSVLCCAFDPDDAAPSPAPGGGRSRSPEKQEPNALETQLYQGYQLAIKRHEAGRARTCSLWLERREPAAAAAGRDGAAGSPGAAGAAGDGSLVLLCAPTSRRASPPVEVDLRNVTRITRGRGDDADGPADARVAPPPAAGGAPPRPDLNPPPPPNWGASDFAHDTPSHLCFSLVAEARDGDEIASPATARAAPGVTVLHFEAMSLYEREALAESLEHIVTSLEVPPCYTDASVYS